MDELDTRELPASDLPPVAAESTRRPLGVLRSSSAELAAVLRPGTASLPALPPKAPGERFGEYELTRKIAESGIGEIFQATQINTGDSGILKRLKREQAGSSIARRRFEFEMELGSLLRHPNLVVVLDSGVVEDRPFLFTQAIKGPSLRQLLQGVAPWLATPELVLGALEQIGHGLAFAHRAGVAHGDVKPENILFESPSKAVLIDFGLAYRFDGGAAGGKSETAPAGYIVGTPVYMPPERLRGEAGALSAAGDVYAFGVMLYEALTGRPPFVLEGADHREAQLQLLIERVCAEPPPPMRHNQVAVAPAWETLCRRCLEKKPQHRPAALDRVAADVGAILRTGKPLAGEATGVVRRITQWLLKGGRP